MKHPRKPQQNPPNTALQEPEAEPSQLDAEPSEAEPSQLDAELSEAEPSQLDAELSEAEPSQLDAALQEPEIQVEIEKQRVQFPEGQDGILVSNNVGPGRIRRYVVNARQGQILYVRLSDLSGPATLEVHLPGGEMIEDASRVLFWEGFLSVGGDFEVDVSSPTSSEFTLDIRVRN